MSILLDYDTYVPLILPSTAEFALVSNTLFSTSGLSGHIKTYEAPGTRWRLRMSFIDVTQDNLAPVRAFVSALRGMAGRFTCYDFTHPEPFVTCTGAIQVDGTPGNNTTIPHTALSGGSFTPGDYISIVRSGTSGDVELKLIVAVPTSTSVTVEPPLQVLPLSNYSGDNISYLKPTALFMLTSDAQGIWRTQGKGRLQSLDLEASEVFI
jgi:hypothetical protein